MRNFRLVISSSGIGRHTQIAVHLSRKQTRAAMQPCGICALCYQAHAYEVSKGDQRDRCTVRLTMRVAGIAAAICLAGGVEAQQSNVLTYPASFFAEAQPNTAYDMIARLP